MSAVYEARDERLERTIALKVLPQEFLHEETFARRFAQEARVIARLEHPKIVPIYASGIDNGIPWMSMRLLTGGNLGARLEHRRAEPRAAVRMLRSVADALDYAHARGVVHRDIKPTNILLDDANEVCLGDFGLAHMLEGDPRATRTGTLLGTPHYIAPERALGEPADHRCDIYSLGIVAYEMFVGTVPFTADSPVAVLLKHVNEPLPTPPDGLLPRGVLDALEKATAKDPAERWPSAGAFVSALEVALGMTPAGLEALKSGRAHRHGARLRFGRAGITVGALLAAIGLTLWITPRESAHHEEPPPLLAFERPSDGAPPIVTAAPVVTQERPDPASSLGPSVTPGPQLLNANAAPGQGQQTATPATEVTPPQMASVVSIPPPETSSLQPRAALVDIPVSTDPTSSAVPSQPVAGEVVTPPIRLRTIPPDYPTAARAAQLEGNVLLQAVVGSDGKVRDVTVLRSVHPLLDEAAKKAVRRYEYTPGQRNGVPEAVTIRLTVSFRLR
jgi:eukaryotic-like serine/threonine-protein kinase